MRTTLKIEDDALLVIKKYPKNEKFRLGRQLPIWSIEELGVCLGSRQRTAGSSSSFLPERRHSPAKCWTNGRRWKTKKSIGVRFLLDVSVLVGLASLCILHTKRPMPGSAGSLIACGQHAL